MTILIYILAGFVLMFAMFAILILMYGPRTSKRLKVGTAYKIKGRSKQIGEFVIHGKMYLMRDHVLDDFYDLIQYADRLLNKHNIPYTAAYGTLLGAVRHGGIMPWDDDADFFVYAPFDKYKEMMLSLKEEIERDGFTLRRNYDTTFYHITKKGAKQNYPYLDLYFYTGQYGDESNIFPIQRIPFEDIEVNAPNKPLACINAHYNKDGKSDPIKEIINDYPLSRYYSLWIAQILKKYPSIHAPMERFVRLFVKLF